jgi:hypothetical protein
MKSQWECVLENLGEWVGSFTTVTPQGELIEDIPSIINLEGIQANQAIHLVLKRFYPLPNSTERYPKEIVWDFSSPPGIGAIYFETGAFSSGVLAVTAGLKTIAEFSLLATDRRFRMIQMFAPDLQLVDNAPQQDDRVTFVREQRQGTTAPERPHLTIPDLLGRWQGIATTFYPHSPSPSVTNTESTFTASDARSAQLHQRSYRFVEDDRWIELTVPNDAPAEILSQRLLHFCEDGQSYQMLLLPDGGYSTTPTQIRLGHPFYLEIGWMYQQGQRQRLVRRYDSTGKWESTTFITEELVLPVIPL